MQGESPWCCQIRQSTCGNTLPHANCPTGWMGQKGRGGQLRGSLELLLKSIQRVKGIRILATDQWQLVHATVEWPLMVAAQEGGSARRGATMCLCIAEESATSLNDMPNERLVRMGTCWSWVANTTPFYNSKRRKLLMLTKGWLHRWSPRSVMHRSCHARVSQHQPSIGSPGILPKGPVLLICSTSL